VSSPAEIKTRVSVSTDLGKAERRAARIRWVHPEERETVIENEVTVGRDEGCGTVLTGPEVSRYHARFSVHGPLVNVTDLQSTNGVHVNGARRPSAPLVVGDVLRCGEWIGIVVADADAGGFRAITPGWYGGAALARAVEPVRKIGADRPIIIQGESGTGKEGVARAIHGWSENRRGTFVAVNCAELEPATAEAELFGWVKGRFSDVGDSIGLFRAAEKGTLFLDEILELPKPVQAKLLRALQEREVRPIGATEPVAVDVRVVVATQVALEDAVAEGRFRNDILARLSSLTVVLPPLRHRREDIVPLARRFLARFARKPMPELHSRLAEAICLYDWPLNVRELEQEIRTLVELHEEERILRRSHLPDRILKFIVAMSEPPPPSDIEASGRKSGSERAAATINPPETPRDRNSRRPVADEKDYEALLVALRENEGNVTRAAETLGISRQRANRVLKEFARDDLRKGK
jgi:sigma-54 dependent transcriptional regulator, acetoin dehydrogenase operon transcriptional activator AcoR